MKCITCLKILDMSTGGWLLVTSMQIAFSNKKKYEEENNVTEGHGDLQDSFWHVVNCVKLPFPPTTWEVATMIFKRIIEKASA